MRECTQTYMTENTRNGDNVMRSLFKGKRRNKNAYPTGKCSPSSASL